MGAGAVALLVISFLVPAALLVRQWAHFLTRHTLCRQKETQPETQERPEQVAGKTRSGSEQENKKTGEPQQWFFPGLPDEIVLEHIATKISWSSVYSLAYVNKKWRGAIRSREIYNFRKDARASQPMLVAPVTNHNSDVSGFYDVLREELWYFSLNFPSQRSEGTRKQAVSSKGRKALMPHQASLSSNDVYHAKNVTFVEGKLYAIRQSSVKEEWRNETRRQEVLMLDAAACHATWKLCSSTREKGPANLWVACNGNIYAFHSYQSRMRGRIFDPKSHQWTKIKHKPSYTHRAHDYHGGVAVLNKQIYVADRLQDRMLVFDTTVKKWPILQNTSVISRFQSFSEFFMVVIREKMYNFSESQVEVYDPDSNSWTVMQHTVHQDFMGHRGRSPKVEAVACYGNELVAVLESPRRYEFSDGTRRNLCKSMGFGIHGQMLEWGKFADFPVRNCKSFDYLEL